MEVRLLTMQTHKAHWTLRLHSGNQSTLLFFGSVVFD